ncbi:hypothetical protein [Phormidium nigroviride]
MGQLTASSLSTRLPQIMVAEGGLFGFVFRMSPKLADNDISDLYDRHTSSHLEAYFSIPVTA